MFTREMDRISKQTGGAHTVFNKSVIHITEDFETFKFLKKQLKEEFEKGKRYHLKDIPDSFKPIIKRYTSKVIRQEYHILNELFETANISIHNRFSEIKITKNGEVSVLRVITIGFNSARIKSWKNAKKVLEKIMPLKGTFKLWKLNVAKTLFEQYSGKNQPIQTVDRIMKKVRVFSPKQEGGKVVHEIYYLKSLKEFIKNGRFINKKLEKRDIERLFPMLIKKLGEKYIIEYLGLSD